MLGFLTGAFFAGAAIVSFVIARLRRRYRYGTILWTGFAGAGLMLIVHTAVTYWREPGLDAVTAAMVTLVPIGLAVSMNAVLLQTLIQLESPPGREGPVLVVYATVTTILAPAGGLVLGAAADTTSVYWALGGAGSRDARGGGRAPQPVRRVRRHRGEARRRAGPPGTTGASRTWWAPSCCTGRSATSTCHGHGRAEASAARPDG